MNHWRGPDSLPLINNSATNNIETAFEAKGAISSEVHSLIASHRKCRCALCHKEAQNETLTSQDVEQKKSNRKLHPSNHWSAPHSVPNMNNCPPKRKKQTKKKTLTTISGQCFGKSKDSLQVIYTPIINRRKWGVGRRNTLETFNRKYDHKLQETTHSSGLNRPSQVRWPNHNRHHSNIWHFKRKNRQINNENLMAYGWIMNWKKKQQQ